MGRTCAILMICVIMFATVAHSQTTIGGLLGALLNFLFPGILSGSPVPTGGNLPGLTSILPLIQGVNASGILCCTPTGNCVAGSPPLAGALVSLNCSTLTGGSVLVGQNRTNSNGVFNILGSIVGANIIPLRCNVTVNLPLDSLVCPALSAVNGTLTSILQPVSLLLSSLLGLVLNLKLLIAVII